MTFYECFEILTTGKVAIEGGRFKRAASDK